MNRPIAEEAFSDKAGEEAPLDPAVERVRRKLLRFAIINLGILFLALAAVVAALVWRTVSASREAASGAPVEARLDLAAGVRVLSQSVSPDAIALWTEEPGGGQAVLVFSRRDGRLVGRYAVGQATVPD